MQNMGQRGSYDFSFSDIMAEGGEGMVELAKTFGLDEALKRWVGGEDTKSDFWTENKKWIVPAGIGTAVLVGVLAFMPKRRRNGK